MFLAASVGLLFAGCGASGLKPLVLDGHELYASLVTQQIDDVPCLHVPRAVLRDSPQLSTDAAFVEAIAHGPSSRPPRGKLLVVVWTYEVSASCWEAVNATVVERLPAAGIPIGPAATNPRPR